MIVESGLSKDPADESVPRDRNSARATISAKNILDNAQNAGIETIDRLLGIASRLFSTYSTLSSDSEGLKDYAFGRGRDWGKGMDSYSTEQEVCPAKSQRKSCVLDWTIGTKKG